MKYSRQRELILNKVIDCKGHPTADEVYDDLKKTNPTLSLGTVYRNLTQLEKNGMLKKVSIPGDPVRFEANLSEHDHFICDTCNKIMDIDVDLAEFSEKILKDYGLKVKSSHVILTGTCKKCQE
nr:transcriptional repressor [uncultured Peptostreptococcus sp.]